MLVRENVTGLKVSYKLQGLGHLPCQVYNNYSGHQSWIIEVC